MAGRTLGRASATALVVANMIGAGVFTTSGFALADLGRRDLVLVAWLVGGVLATLGALSYGALGRRLPESGGEYLFLARIFHPLAGFLAGWVSLLAGFTAPIAAAALGLQAYLASAVELPVRGPWVGTGAIALAGALHGLRLRQGVWAQNAAVVIKLAAIVAFVAVAARGLELPSPESVTAPAPDPLAFAVTLVFVSFAYSGWNAAVYVAGEIRAPERNLAPALLGATLVVTVVYVALNGVFVYAAPISELAGRPDVGAAAAAALGGPGLQRALSALVALALFTSVSAMVMAGPRVYAQMARDGLLPRALAHAGDGAAPGRAVALQVALATAVLWSSGLAELLGYIGFTLGLSAAATVIGLIVLRRREGPVRVPVPGYPWVPGLFSGATLLIAVFMALREPGEALAGLATLAAGVPVYFAMRRMRRRSRTGSPG